MGGEDGEVRGDVREGGIGGKGGKEAGRRRGSAGWCVVGEGEDGEGCCWLPCLPPPLAAFQHCYGAVGDIVARHSHGHTGYPSSRIRPRGAYGTMRYMTYIWMRSR